MPHTQRPAGARRKKPTSRGLSPLDRLRLERLYHLRDLQRRQADAARESSAGKWPTPGAMAAALDPSTIQTAALDLIDAALVDVAEGRCKRLIITMPPQEGKSQRVSRRFPSWLLVRRPSARIVLVGYELGIARRWGRTIKNDIATHGDMLGLAVRDDTSAAHEWQLAGDEGGVYCVGIGGALTGRPADCLHGDSLVDTEDGPVAILDLHTANHRPRVRAFDHTTGRWCWRPVVATREILDRPLVEIRTAGGRHLVCTPDHRVHTVGGYRAAGDLPVGAVLTSPDGHDTVSAVHSRGDRAAVYDIQVDQNHNFVAGGLLVHNCMIIDDPHKGRADADSIKMRENVWDWWTETARTRFGTETPVVLVQTRWHEDDLAGRLLEHDRGSWRVINIPAEADHRPELGEVDTLGRDPGAFLVSTRGRHLPRPMGKCSKHPDGIETPAGGRRECCDWDDIKHDVGTRGWQALYQGAPAPSGGVIFDKTWWQRYEQPQWIDRADGSRWAVNFDELLISVDCAFKATDGSDYVAMQVWGRRGVEAYLLDQVHDRLTFVETCARLEELAAKWPQALLKLVEDAANGPAVINSLRRKVPGLVPVTPHGSKVARAAAVSPFVEGRGVWLPDPKLAPWVGALITEAAQFPQSTHDDRVDCLSQALDRLLLDPLLTDDRIVEDDEDGPAEGSISMY